MKCGKYFIETREINLETKDECYMKEKAKIQFAMLNAVFVSK